MGIVYVLKLEAGRWYCGYTDNLEQRIAQHFLGRGADWTRIWKPLSLFSAVEGDMELENAQTVALMAQHGWRKVRGGKYTSPALSAQPKVLGQVLSRAIPARDPKPAFVDELVVGEQKVRFYRSLDGYTASVGGVVFEGATFGEVLGGVEESLGQNSAREKETETNDVYSRACRGADGGGDAQNAMPGLWEAASDSYPGREAHLRPEAAESLENGAGEAAGQKAGGGGAAISR